jgi:arginase
VERGPEALRAAEIVEKLRQVGYQVTDGGDLPASPFQPDPENPRARNLRNVLAMLDGLRVRVEQSSRSHALPVVLGGDATIVLALVAGLRRQAASLGLIHVGRYADLRTPTRTEDGLVEPMTGSHLVGQGAPELIRFWKDPPLVREPDLVLFGLGETDEIDRDRLEQLAIRRVPLTRIRQMGPKDAAEMALERLRASSRDFVIHLSLDAFSAEEMPGCPRGAAGGLSLDEAREAMNCFAALESFAGLSVSGYDPGLDPEGQGAVGIVDLVVAALAVRHTALLQPAVTEEPETSSEEAGKPGAEAEPAGVEKAARAEEEKPKGSEEAGGPEKAEESAKNEETGPQAEDDVDSRAVEVVQAEADLTGPGETLPGAAGGSGSTVASTEASPDEPKAQNA